MKKLTLICCLFATTPLLAAPVATVLFTAKKVTATNAAATRELTRGATLEAGDAISTVKDGLANIKYKNGTLVNIGSESNYKILDYSPNKADVQIKAELNKGSISSKTNGTTKETVKTPVIALAILGTQYEVAFTCGGGGGVCSGGGSLNIHVTEGSVQAGSTLLTPGSSVLVTSSGIRNEAFPSSLKVNEPPGAEGKISSSSDSSALPPAPNPITAVTLSTVQTDTSSTNASYAGTVGAASTSSGGGGCC